MSTTNNNEEIQFKLEPYNRGISDDELIADMQHVAQSLGANSLKYDDYDKLGHVRSRTIELRFGSWNNALIKAGLHVQRYMNISKEKLFENIEQVWIRLGRQPRYEEMQKPFSSYHGANYRKRFGTWRKALEEFISYVNSDSCGEVASEPDVSRAKKQSARQPNLRLRFLVMRRDNFKCQYCGKSPATHTGVELQVDHVIPWAEGGQTVIENLQTLCAECNLGKSNQPPTETPD